MKIIAVSTVKEEPDLPQILDHMLTQGVDGFCISADDFPTFHLANKYGYAEPCQQPFNQSVEITRLARHSTAQTADWIIPFDADEYWCGTNGTIREVLERTPEHITIIHAPTYLHLDATRRVHNPKPLGKIAVRPHPDLIIHWGQHGSNREGEAEHGTLQIREVQYASWEHLQHKVRKARDLHDTGTVPDGVGTHMVRLAKLDDTQLWEWWQEYLAQPTVDDPIPGSGKWM